MREREAGREIQMIVTTTPLPLFLPVHVSLEKNVKNMETLLKSGVEERGS
ncbi:hypothetical protein [Nitrososphaera viennensis]|uniref:Uncharacterized protein n=1 Tax=Nitrososphaera viennensis TaxID=1034015 RepID=A0A977NL29_9ARCH|nr:hypothetical protein [Nitrososphaera viennensis]UVS68359.1 hypothetical protein NWT39_10665 [Nitrososphaera viennensis]